MPFTEMEHKGKQQSETLISFKLDQLKLCSLTSYIIMHFDMLLIQIEYV